MSYSHNQRKKSIRRFKKAYAQEQFSNEWHHRFREFVAELEKARLGSPICTLSDLTLFSYK